MSQICLGLVLLMIAVPVVSFFTLMDRTGSELDALRRENARLEAKLRRHGIDPSD